MHLAGDHMMNPAGSSSFTFFIVQPVGIVIEESFLSVLSKTGLWTRAKDDKQSRSWQGVVGKWVGYVWVLFWFQYWLVKWFDCQIRAGLGTSIRFPVSVAEGVLTGNWVR